jgi:capsule biosynthesis phosphatase
MISDRRLVVDIDGVIAKKEDMEYSELNPDEEVLTRLREYEKRGFEIVLYTARNMNTYDEKIGKINANTAPVLLRWLDKYDVPYDEIHYGKPWCGNDGFYVDDKAVRPSEFVEMSHKELRQMVVDAER